MRTLPIIVAALALSSACTHHRNVTRSEALSGPDAEVYVSSVAYEDGSPRHVVVEEDRGVVDGCTDVTVTGYAYAPSGALETRTVESRRCGIPTREVVERFDFNARSWVRSVKEDRDQDGSFDVAYEQPASEPRSVLTMK